MCVAIIIAVACKKQTLAVIKYFPRGYFYHDKEYPLSPSMIAALKKVCASQKKRKPFGPKDMKRALYPLIERGLISLTYYCINDEKKATWGVTKKGLRNLQSIARIQLIAKEEF